MRHKPKNQRPRRARFEGPECEALLAALRERLSPEGLAQVAVLLQGGGRAFGQDAKPWHHEAHGLSELITQNVLGIDTFNALVADMGL